MKQTRFSHRISLFLLAALIIISCSITGSPISTVPPGPTDTQAIETQPEDTEIAQPSATTQFTLTAVQDITATSPGPSCTVLQDLNMRFGPGTAYRPPITPFPQTPS